MQAYLHTVSICIVKKIPVFSQPVNNISSHDGDNNSSDDEIFDTTNVRLK